MIDFRYHLVSIIAVFFALAVGIVLGAGPLGERVDADLPDQLNSMREQNGQLQEQIRSLESIQDYRDGFIEAVTPEIISGRLDNRDVAVLAMPNADGDLAAGVADMLRESGAEVTASVRVDTSWTDAESEAALDALAANLASTGITIPEEGDGYDRGAALLAQAFLISPEEVTLEEGLPSEIDELTLGVNRQIDEEIVVGLSEAGFIEVDDEPERKAELAVVVAGPLVADDSTLPVEPLLTVARALDEAGAGTVVAGPPLGSEGELIPAIRDDGELSEQISTIDSADLLVGRVAVVFAILEQESGDAGQYGYSGSPDGPMPPIPAGPAPEEQQNQDSGEPDGDGPTGEADANGSEDGEG
ncbi:MAG TPA: copper transporter [Jiangellales bacterium]|nr:copper transporter [Jiangellales bacterium]